MAATVILGLQWGDEGKGKLVDALAPQHTWVCRFQGGPNAGHTLVVGGQKHVVHQIPSGIFHGHSKCVIGNGVVLNPITLREELDMLTAVGVPARDRLIISTRAHLILPSHRLLDAAHETSKGTGKIGSTLRGIGPAYQDKYARHGLRVGDLLRDGFQQKLDILLHQHQQQLDWIAGANTFDAREGLADFLAACDELKQLRIADTEILLGEALNRGDHVLLEGAQGSLLDVDFGAYPFVTSSHTLAGGASVGLGIAPKHLQHVVGVFKAYCTRVGNGPFPTELLGTSGDDLRNRGHEFGSTTGRPRRVGWLDLAALRYAILLSGVTELSIMKVDVLAGMPSVEVCTHYTTPTGETLRYLPEDCLTVGSAGVEATLTPHYATLPGWPSFGAEGPVPPELEGYLRFIEQHVEVPIRHVSMGPEREALLVRA